MPIRRNKFYVKFMKRGGRAWARTNNIIIENEYVGFVYHYSDHCNTTCRSGSHDFIGYCITTLRDVCTERYMGYVPSNHSSSIHDRLHVLSVSGHSGSCTSAIKET